MNSPKKLWIYGLLSVLLILGAFALQSSNFSNASQKRQTANFENAYAKLVAEAEQRFGSFVAQYHQWDGIDLFNFIGHSTKFKINNGGLAVFVFENDSLKFWSDNAVPIHNLLLQNNFAAPVARFGNGWFRVLKGAENGRTYIGLQLIKHDYAHQNQYLVNEFVDELSAFDNLEISLGPPGEGAPILIKGNEPDFYLVLSEGESAINSAGWIPSILLLLGFTLLIYFLLLASDYAERKMGVLATFGVFVLLISMFRAITFSPIFADVLGQYKLFSPTLFASSSLFRSLGDFLINSLLLLVIANRARVAFRKARQSLPRKNTALAKVLATLIPLVLVFSGYAMQALMGELIENSSIALKVNDLFGLSIYSFIALFSIAALFLAYIVFADGVLSVFMRLFHDRTSSILLGLVIAIAIFLFAPVYSLDSIAYPLFIIVILGVIYYHKERDLSLYSFSSLVLLLAICALSGAHLLNDFVDAKERQNRMVFAEKLATKEDPVTEFLFSEIEDELIKEPLFKMPFLDPANFESTKFSASLQAKYFTGYWEKYDITSTFFGNDSIEIGGVLAVDFKEFDSYKKLLLDHGYPTSASRNLVLIQNPSDRMSYIIQLPVLDSAENGKLGTVFLELNSKLIPEEIGFPELLLDRSARILSDISNYSYARFVNGTLVNVYGSFQYPVTPGAFEVSKDAQAFYMDLEEYNHLVYRVSPGSYLILSMKQDDFISAATTFSYIFAFFSILLLITLLLRNLRLGLGLSNINLKSRIQFMLIAVILSSLILFALGTAYYIQSEYHDKNKNFISEKVHSVQIEVSNKLKGLSVLGPENENYINYLMRKFGNVFFTDISLFDPNGNVLGTSQLRLFEQGLVSKKMNPEAYQQLVIKGKSEFVHQEHIGNMEYLSAYAPFLNSDGEVLAYLNLPYFAKQNELENEIASFLVRIINIFVLLFALSIVAGLFISNWITRPLKLLQERFGSIDLGKANEPIHYEREDEIGNLVQEYNSKVAELEVKAELLARSERESAWREMAKQVAHEIKNPLTPMKLSVQHLKRSWADKPEDWDERLEKFSESLIQQIDSLSNIASEFSNFAKMPSAKRTQFDLLEVLNNTVNLYKKETSQVEITLKSEIKGPLYLMADADQINRVFSNLLKNSIQAIDAGGIMQGEIFIRVGGGADELQIEVTDNGPGIPEDRKDKIFVPSFTTKTTGMGMGLAMVKNIVESSGGRIWFTSSENQGTSFFISLPRMAADN